MSEDFLLTTTNKPYDISHERMFTPKFGVIDNTVLTIPGAVCKRWIETDGRICPFCAFPAFVLPITEGKTFETGEFLEMYQNAFQRPCDRLTIFNGGSFFPQEEIPLDFQQQVFEDFSEREDIKMLAVETRPEYFTREVASRARDALGEKDFMIMIGLESFQTKVRNGLLKKAMSQESFLNTLALAKKFRIKVFVYVMLGAPGLSEQERIQDTLDSLKALAELGVDEMGLSCTFVSPGTKLLEQYTEGEFLPPNLWSIIHVLQEADKNNWPLRFGGFEETPAPIAISSSCNKCSDILHGSLSSHRRTGKFNHKISCDCEGASIMI